MSSVTSEFCKSAFVQPRPLWEGDQIVFRCGDSEVRTLVYIAEGSYNSALIYLTKGSKPGDSNLLSLGGGMVGGSASQAL